MSGQNTNNTPSDTLNEIDINPKVIIGQIDSWIDGFTALLPNIAVALVLIILSFFVGSFVGKLIFNRFKKRDRYDLGMMIKGLVKWSIIILGVLFSATIVMPTLNPGELVAGLGVGSVAIGFAFKDILQNWFAGLLILLRQPFQIGDQIEVNGYEGTVEHIETRSTLIKTYDGQRAVIPNSDIYTNAIIVRTAYEKRRSQYDIGIGYGDDAEKAVKLLKEAISSVKDVEQDPAVQVFPWDLAASWVTLRLRWWTNSKCADIVSVKSDVIITIKNTLDEAGIDMPYDTQVHLFHDQTEETDGDRTAQREGWPAGDKPPKAAR